MNRLSPYQVMKRLVDRKVLLEESGGKFWFDEEDRLLWSDKNVKSWTVDGDGWSSLFEDCIFNEEDNNA